jgi:SepF-like predicted cell division protein (DUF552 family)
MKKFFEQLKATFTGAPKYDELDAEEGYVELDSQAGDSRSRILVRPFQLDDFEDVKPILDALREGYTIALVNIKPLKERDLVELKRAINKLKKTTDAIEGEIAGFGDDYIIVTPSFASIYRSKQTKEVKAAPEEAAE